MSGKGPFECFACKNNGFPAVMVFLAGKDDQGRAIRQEADGSPHQHKSKAPSQQQQQTQQQELTSQKPIWDIVNAKLDKIIALLQQGHENG